VITESNENPYRRVAEDDPQRCQAVTGTGQCRIVRAEGSDFCLTHAGGLKASQEKEKVRNYRLTKWRAAVEGKADSTAIKDISEEIGILRVIIQERIEACESNTDLIINSGPLSDLVMKCATLVNQLQTMETKLGTMLHANQAIQFAAEILEVVGRHVDNAETQEAIANEIEAALQRATG